MPGEGPTRFLGTRFDRQDVRLDGVEFERCVFGPGCRLVFRGEALPALRECRTEGEVRYVLGGSALTTLQFLSMLLHDTNGYGRELVEQTIDDLRRGRFRVESGPGSVDDHG